MTRVGDAFETGRNAPFPADRGREIVERPK